MVKQKMRVGVKAAWISIIGVVLASIIGGISVYMSDKKDASKGETQNAKEQKVDSGSINNYNSGNNQYNNTIQGDNNRIVNGDHTELKDAKKQSK